MTHNCRTECRKFGKRKERQRYQCTQCHKVFTDARDNTLDGMYCLSRRLKWFSSSCSKVILFRAWSAYGRYQKTILKLLVLAGEKCERIIAKKIVNVQVRDVEFDEVWSFIWKKQKRVKPEDDQNLGDPTPSSRLSGHSKLVLNIAMGKRDQTDHGYLWKAFDTLHPLRLSKSQLTGFAALPDCDQHHLHDRSLRHRSSRSIKLRATAKPGTAR